MGSAKGSLAAGEEGCKCKCECECKCKPTPTRNLHNDDPLCFGREWVGQWAVGSGQSVVGSYEETVVGRCSAVLHLQYYSYVLRTREGSRESRAKAAKKNWKFGDRGAAALVWEAT